MDLIGDTPMVALRSVLTTGTQENPRSSPLVLAKLEYLNPGGSVKDRIAQRMIDAAEQDGSLQLGGTIVEPNIEWVGLVGPAARLRVRVRLSRQGLRGQNRRVAGVWGAGRGLPDRCAARASRVLLQRF